MAIVTVLVAVLVLVVGVLAIGALLVDWRHRAAMFDPEAEARRRRVLSSALGRDARDRWE